MTPDEIRKPTYQDSDESGVWLREIAAQLAEMNYTLKDVVAGLDQLAVVVKP